MMTIDKEIENYRITGKRPRCGCCCKKEGVMAKVFNLGSNYYLSWRCNDCLFDGYAITPESTCENCGEPLMKNNKIYCNYSEYFCSKECAIKYSGYMNVEEWAEWVEDLDHKTGLFSNKKK